MNNLITNNQVENILENIDRSKAIMGEATILMKQAHEKHAQAKLLLDGTCSTYGAYMSREYDDDFQENKEGFLKSYEIHCDRRVWGQILEMANFEDLMDATEKAKFKTQISSMEVEPSLENIVATLQRLRNESGEMFSRGIATCFSKLDRRFKSHDGFKIGSRIIINRAFDLYSSSVNRGYITNTLRDIEKTFLILDGKPLHGHEIPKDDNEEPPICYDIVKDINDSQTSFDLCQAVIENDYFKIRIFKNGNVHIYFLRTDLVEQVNKILAEYYGENLGEAHSAREEDVFSDVGRVIKTARNFGFFPTPKDVIDRLINRFYVHKGDEITVLEPSAGTGNIAKELVKKGAIVDCVEIQTGLALELEEQGIYKNVFNMDFLKMDPQIHGKKYDYIYMNPPFDRGLDMEHIVHAMKFLKPGGILEAVMSASIEFRQDKKSIAFREMIKESDWQNGITDLPEGSFKEVGANVNTCIIRYRNKP